MTTIVYGYGQGSFDVKVPPTDAQKLTTHEAFQVLLKAGHLSADSHWAGFSRDEPSLKPVKFRQRHAGSLLLATLRRDDVVIVTSHDRIFSSVDDACETLGRVQQIGFRLIVLDCGFDTGRPGESLWGMNAMMKSLRARERRRTKEEFEYRKRQGMPAGGRTPIGWELVRADLDGVDRAYFVPDHGARRLAHYIAEQYDSWAGTRCGTFVQTAQWLNSRKVFRPDGKPWRKTAVFNWYHAAKAGFPLPGGRREAFPIPVGANPLCHARYAVPDDDD